MHEGTIFDQQHLSWSTEFIIVYPCKAIQIQEKNLKHHNKMKQFVI